MGILVLEFGSLGILYIEQYQQGANITSASDALWYVIVTISTVGYGDRFPVTDNGRLLGTLIIVIGVGIFGTFTGFLANLFLAPSKKARPSDPLSRSNDRAGQGRPSQGAHGRTTSVDRRDRTTPAVRQLIETHQPLMAPVRRGGCSHRRAAERRRFRPQAGPAGRHPTGDPGSRRHRSCRHRRQPRGRRHPTVAAQAGKAVEVEQGDELLCLWPCVRRRAPDLSIWAPARGGTADHTTRTTHPGVGW